MTTLCITPLYTDEYSVIQHLKYIKTVQVLIIYSIKKTVVKIDSSCNEIAESEQIVWSSLWTIHLKYTPLPVLFSIL